MSVRLLSSDNIEFVVRKEIAMQSVFLENMVLEVEPDFAIPLSNVTGKVLEKVIEWCDHHCQDIREENHLLEMDDWDKAFFQMEHNLLFDIILAANYLDIKKLLNGGCQTVSKMIKGKSANEIRDTFKTTNHSKDEA